jgi:hypothetical protein
MTNRAPTSTKFVVTRVSILLATMTVCACGERSSDKGGSPSASTKVRHGIETHRDFTTELEACMINARRAPTQLRESFRSFCLEADAKGVPGAILRVELEASGTDSTISYGRRCSDDATPPSDTTRFPIASLTKSASALIALDLLANTDAATPESQFQPGPSYAKIVDLLRHESGLVFAGAQRTPGKNQDPAGPHPDRWFDAGSMWHYDNGNYSELGRWIDRKQPGRFRLAWESRFAQGGPVLGRGSAENDVACEHDWLDHRGVVLPPSDDPRNASALADGGAYASATEVITLLEHIQDEPRLTASTVPTGEGDRYGLGVRVETSGLEDPVESWGHSGATRGSWSWMRGDEKGARAVLLVNRNLSLEDTRSSLRVNVFDLPAKRTPPALDEEQIVGTFLVRGWSAPVVVRQDQQRFRLDAVEIGSEGLELRPVGHNEFVAHLPGAHGASTLVLVSRDRQLWLRTPWFVAQKRD